MYISVILLLTLLYRVVFDRTIEILLVVCASILPTPTLLPYIEFFVSTLTSSQRDLCYSYLTQCKQIGTREEMCALEEIDVLLVYIEFFDK